MSSSSSSSAFEELLVKLPSELRAKAASLAIYGHDANQMLLTTRDDDLYVVNGFNGEPAFLMPTATSLININNNIATAPAPVATTTTTTAAAATTTTTTTSAAGYIVATRIDLLCGKHVCEVAHSPNPNNARYLLVRTYDGELYTFGDVVMTIDDTTTVAAATSTAPISKRRISSQQQQQQQQACTLFSAHPLLQDKKIVQIACGFNHAVCLTSYGEIFAWSIAAPPPPRRATSSPSMSPRVPKHSSSSAISDYANQPTSGQMMTTSQSKLTLFGCIARRRSPFVEIATYQDIIVGLDEDGRLYEWHFAEHQNNASPPGLYNQVVELTSDENMYQCRQLTSDATRDVRVCHIAAGRAHCLAVTSTFAVYAWGSNDSGQLGLGLPASAVSSPSPPPHSPSRLGGRHHTSGSGNLGAPCRVPFFDELPGGPMKKIKAIGAHSQLDMSIAEAVTGDIYVWGDLAVGGFSACTSRPTWTRCRSVVEALQSYGRLAFTPSTSLVAVAGPSLTRCLLEAFDNPENADVQFIVPGFAPIYTHRQFLQIRAPRFLATFGSKSWQQSRSVLISVDHVTYAVLRAFMRFLYTNEFPGVDKQTAELDCDDLINLAELAEQCDEALLRKLVCDHIIANCLTIENAAFIYSSSLQRPHLDREGSLPCACLSFILANLVDVVRSETFVSLDGAVAKRILVEAASVNKPAANKKQ